ncbi:MAG TPA: DUF6496 domain-containing protein [Gammaproteobacteria bacterium]|jgi:hypothetical protein|nr:DUF6496 domain-containing protein [Gammaproteobacteria bacterium]
MASRHEEAVIMARRYSKSASKDVEREMKAFKQGKLKSGPGGRGGKVKSRKQAIAIGLSEARREGKKVPKKPVGRRKKTGGRKKKSSSRRKRS